MTGPSDSDPARPASLKRRSPRFGGLARLARTVRVRREPRVTRVAAKALSSFLRHHGPSQAAAIAFYSILSIIPVYFLTVLALGELLGDRAQALKIAERQLAGIMPWFDDSLMSRIRRLTWAAPHLSIMSLVFIAWTAGLFFAAIRRSLIAPWKSAITEAGPRLRHLADFWLVTPAVSLCLLAVLAASAYLCALPHILLTQAELRAWAGLLPAWRLLWPWVFESALYLLLLPGTRPLSLTLAVSGILALAGWGLTALFAGVLVHLPRQALVYGPMAGTVLFLLWLDYNALLLVYGGHFIHCWRLESRR